MTRFHRLIEKIKHKLPTQEEIFRSKWLKPFARFLNKDYYWHFTRHNVALGVAIGLFVGFLPAPQIVPAFIGAYLLRANLAVTIFTSFYSNIFTYIPLTYFAYRVGEKILLGGAAGGNERLTFYEASHWSFSQFGQWMQDNLIYLLVGIPVLGMICAVVGYLLVTFLWRFGGSIKELSQSHKQKKAEAAPAPSSKDPKK